MSRYYVFYATLLYREQDYLYFNRSDLPDGVFIFEPKDREGKYWYLKDLTPVLPEDVPKVLRTLVLLMGIHP